MQAFKKFFSAPIYPDEETTRRAGLLSFLINLHIFVAFSTAFMLAVFTTMRPIFPLAALVSALPGLALRVLMRRGRVTLASILFVSMIFLIMPTIAWFSGSSVVTVPVTVFQTITIVMAGLLLGGRSAAVFVALTGAVNGALIYAELNGGYVTDTSRDPVSNWVMQVIAFSAITAMLYITNRLLHESFARARRENEERRAAEAEVRKKEQLYRNAIEAANAVPYYLNYKKSTYDFIGGGILDLTGYAPGEINQEVYDSLIKEVILIGEAAEYPLDEAVRRARCGEIATWQADNLITTRDGDERWLNDSSVQVRNESGEVIGSIGILQDITARKQAESAIRESEERYRMISSVTSDYTFSTKIDGEGNMSLNWVAGAFEAMTGYSMDEYKIYGGWLAHLYPEDVEKDLQALAKLKNNQSVMHEIRTITKAKKLQWVQVYAHPIWDENTSHLVGIVGAVKDITARKQAEAELQKSASRLELLHNIDRALLSAQSPIEIAREAITRIRQLIPSRRTSITMFDFERNEATFLVASFDEDFNPAGQSVITLQEYGQYIIDELLQEKACRVDDVLTDPRCNELDKALAQKGFRSWLYLPLLSQGQLIGGLNFGRAVGNPFTDEEESIAYEVSNQLAIVLRQNQLNNDLQIELAERKQAEEKIIKTANQLVALNEIGRAVSEVTDLREVLEIIRHELEKLLPFDFYSVRVFNAEGRSVSHLAIYENGQYWDEADAPLVPGTDAHKVFETGRSVLHLYTEGELEAYKRAPLMQIGDHTHFTASVIFAPLKKQGQTIGALSVQRYEPNSYTEEHLKQVEAVAIQVAIAIENARLFTGIQQELAERQRAEADARRLEDLYRRAINSAGAVPYYLDNRKRVYTFMGEGILQMTGYSPDEITPELWESLEQERFPRGGLAHLTYEEADHLTQENNSIPWECDYRIRTKDGQTRWVADTSIRGEDEYGETRGVIGILQDITERKIAEQQLRQRLQELSAIHAVSQAASSKLEWDALFELVSNELFRLFDIQEIYFALHDQTNSLVQFPYYRHGNQRIETEPVPLGQGLSSRVILSRQPLVINNDYEQRSAELGVVRFSLTPSHLNQISWLGVPIQSGEQVIGMICVMNLEHENAFTEANVHLLTTIAANVGNAIQTAQLFMTVQQELAERKHAEEQVRQLNEELEERVRQRTADLESANKELEAFSYSVSHDLRAPLRAIISFSKILEDDFSAGMDPMGRSFLQKVIDAGRKMSVLIDDLLSFSRLGRKTLAREAVDLNEVVRSVLDSFVPETAGRQIEWLLSELPPAYADSGLIQQVYANLIGNAIKYTGKLPLARIEIGSLQQNGETAYFVRDNGAGFDMKYAERLFGVFQRLHRDDEFEGIGIGLATVRRIIERHGGRIWAEAEPNKGATFYFTMG